MSGGLAPILLVLIAVGVVLAGGTMLRQGVVSLAAARGSALIAGAVCAAIPLFLICAGAAALDLTGAAIGAVTGALTAATFLTAIIAATGSSDRLRGSGAFAILVVISCAALCLAEYDTRIGRSEGMLLVAAAVFSGWWGHRLGGRAEGTAATQPGRRLPLAVGGAVIVVAGVALALAQVRPLAIGQPDGAMMVGLTGLGAVAAAPQVLASWRETRAGGGPRVLLEMLIAAVMGLFGAIGAAAMIRPLPVPESFLRTPLAVLAADGLVLLWLSFARKPLPRFSPIVGGVLYAVSLIAFLRVDA